MEAMHSLDFDEHWLSCPDDVDAESLAAAGSGDAGSADAADGSAAAG